MTNGGHPRRRRKNGYKVVGRRKVKRDRERLTDKRKEPQEEARE